MQWFHKIRLDEMIFCTCRRWPEGLRGWGQRQIVEPKIEQFYRSNNVSNGKEIRGWRIGGGAIIISSVTISFIIWYILFLFFCFPWLFFLLLLLWKWRGIKSKTQYLIITNGNALVSSWRANVVENRRHPNRYEIHSSDNLAGNVVYCENTVGNIAWVRCCRNIKKKRWKIRGGGEKSRGIRPAAAPRRKRRRNLRAWPVTSDQ